MAPNAHNLVGEYSFVTVHPTMGYMAACKWDDPWQGLYHVLLRHGHDLVELVDNAGLDFLPTDQCTAISAIRSATTQNASSIAIKNYLNLRQQNSVGQERINAAQESLLMTLREYLSQEPIHVSRNKKEQDILYWAIPSFTSSTSGLAVGLSAEPYQLSSTTIETPSRILITAYTIELQEMRGI